MWSMGVLAYVLLSGYSPFAGDCKQETYLNITQAQLDFPTKLFADVSESAIEFICALLQRKPSDRLTCEQASSHHWLQCKSIKSSIHDLQSESPIESESMHTSPEPQFDLEPETEPPSIEREAEQCVLITAKTTVPIQNDDMVHRSSNGHLANESLPLETQPANSTASNTINTENSKSAHLVTSNGTSSLPPSSSPSSPSSVCTVSTSSCQNGNSVGVEHQITTDKSAQVYAKVMEEPSICLKKGKLSSDTVAAESAEDVEPKKKRTLSDCTESNGEMNASETKARSDTQKPPDQSGSPKCTTIKPDEKTDIGSESTDHPEMEVATTPTPPADEMINENERSTSIDATTSDRDSNTLSSEDTSSSEPCSLEVQPLIDTRSQSPVELNSTVCSLLGSVLNSVSNADALNQPTSQNGPMLNALACAL